MSGTVAIAYCGPAATPADLLTRWKLDPLLIAALAALAIVIATGRLANAGARPSAHCPRLCSRLASCTTFC